MTKFNPHSPDCKLQSKHHMICSECKLTKRLSEFDGRNSILDEVIETINNAYANLMYVSLDMRGDIIKAVEQLKISNDL